MRLRSKVWIQAYLWRCGAETVPAVVVRKGDEDAGVVYIKVNALDGTVDLYGPAASGFSEVETERRWSQLQAGAPEADADAFLARQISFDPDAWIIEIEARDRRHLLDDWLAPKD